MQTIRVLRDGPELLQRWRQQIAAQDVRRQRRGPRPLAAISYVARGLIQDGLVDLTRLLFVVVHDEWHEQHSLVTCCRAYVSAPVPWGARIGGAQSCRLDKFLTLAPKRNARGRRFDLAQPELLRLCMDLDRHLERQAQFPHAPRRRQPLIPELWAGFTPTVATGIHCAGPEFDAAGQPHVSPRRGANGLVLLPLEFVSHESARCAAILADVSSMPKRQVVTLGHRAANLVGFQGAVEFDLNQSRFSDTAAMAITAR